MEAAAAMFMLVAVSGNQAGPISFHELGRFRDEAACRGAAEAITAEIKAQGEMMVDLIGCVSADDLKAMGEKSFGGQ